MWGEKQKREMGGCIFGIGDVSILKLCCLQYPVILSKLASYPGGLYIWIFTSMFYVL